MSTSILIFWLVLTTEEIRLFKTQHFLQLVLKWTWFSTCHFFPLHLQTCKMPAVLCTNLFWFVPISWSRSKTGCVFWGFSNRKGAIGPKLKEQHKHPLRPQCDLIRTMVLLIWGAGGFSIRNHDFKCSYTHIHTHRHEWCDHFYLSANYNCGHINHKCSSKLSHKEKLHSLDWILPFVLIKLLMLPFFVGKGKKHKESVLWMTTQWMSWKSMPWEKELKKCRDRNWGKTDGYGKDPMFFPSSMCLSKPLRVERVQKQHLFPAGWVNNKPGD